MVKKSQEQPVASLILDYDNVQADYAGARATTSWSQRLAEQFSQAERSTRKNLGAEKVIVESENMALPTIAIVGRLMLGNQPYLIGSLVSGSQS